MRAPVLLALLVLVLLPLPAAAAPRAAPDDDRRVLVAFHPDAAPDAVADAEARAGAVLDDVIPQLGVRVLRVPAGRPDQAVEALRRNPSVRYAELDAGGEGAAVPSDPLWPQQWGPALVRGPAAWDITVGAEQVTIALLDSGITAAHPDLAGRIVAGYDVVNGDADPADDQGHGTSVTGVAAASAMNGTGLAGMCWRCSIMPVKVLDANNWATWSNLSSGIVWAVDHGAQVLSISITGTSGGTTLQNAVRYAVDRGAVVVAAAGNSGSTALGYPAAFEEVLSVAGSTSGDGRYSWSSHGSWVDAAAPGCNQTTTRSGGYSSFCGTSSATPLVAGIAGLLRSAVPGTTVAQVRSAITSTAVPVGSWVAHGRVDAAAALTAVGGVAPQPEPQPDPQPQPDPEPEPEPEPEPDPTPTTTTVTGALTNKISSRSHAIPVGAGSLAAVLDFTREPTLTLTLLDPSGRQVAQTTGATGLQLAADVTAGTWTVVVSGSGRSSYTLRVTAPAP
jgi:subtilisin family serine protease